MKRKEWEQMASEWQTRADEALGHGDVTEYERCQRNADVCRACAVYGIEESGEE